MVPSGGRSDSVGSSDDTPTEDRPEDVAPGTQVALPAAITAAVTSPAVTSPAVTSPAGTSPAGTSASDYPDAVPGSRLDHALTWYRGELELRRLVGLLALPALVCLTGFGMLTDPGPVSWILAGLAFLAGTEVASASVLLHRRAATRGRPPADV